MEKLKKGDKVAIVSLSSGILGESFVKHELDLGVKRLKELGLFPVFMNNSLLGMETLKNNPNLRADDLKQALNDKEIKAVISAIGGNDAYKLLPYIMNDEFKKCVQENPKIFMGYSDTTTIHLALNKLGLKTFYGPALLTDFAEFEDEILPYTKESVEQLFLMPKKYEIKSSEYWYKERTDFSPNAVGTPREKYREVKGFESIGGNNTAKGKLLGGCIEIIYSLLNAQFDSDNYSKTDSTYDIDSVEILKQFPIMPKPEELKENILFLETSDSKIEPEKYRKIIKKLKNLRYFSEINGLICGKPMDEAYYDDYKQILIEELSEYNFPILTNVNFGHAFPRTIIPYGEVAEINPQNKTLKITTL